jgi:S-formylglutathione hydrolase FrmB
VKPWAKKIMKKYSNFPTLSFVILLSFVATPLVNAQTTSKTKQTAQFFKLNSKLLNRQISYAVVLPKNYQADDQTRFPVVYLLHGFGGSHKDFVSFPELFEIYSLHKFIVVTVEGEKGFYTDSQTKPDEKHESYVIKELIPEVDKNFRTISARNARAIVGDSMGGYGALKFGLKYPQMFAMVGSWSGGLTIASWRKPSEIDFIVPNIKESLTSVFGDGSNPATLQANDLFELIKNVPTEKISSLPFIYLDCGTEDELGLLKPNQQFAEIMVNRKIRHEYRQVPGEHTVQLYRLGDVLELCDRIFAESIEKK